MRLVGAVQRQEQVLVVATETADGDLLAANGDLTCEQPEVVALERHSGTDLFPPIEEDLCDVRLLRPDDGNRVGLDDPRLLGGDVDDVVAEEVLVVERDRGDHGNRAVRDVRRVPAPAEAHLDDGDVHGGVGERGIRDRHEHLEVGHPRPVLGDRLRIDHLDEGDHVVIGVEELLAADRLAGQRDPLTHAVQVRRGEAAGPQPHLREQRVDDARRGRLAVRAGQVDGGIAALRVAEQLHHRGDAVQARLEVVLGGAGEDRRLHLTHPPHELEVARGLALG